MAYSPKNPNGQAAMADSEPVVIASNQTAVPVSFTGSTDVATQTTLAAINTKLVSGTDIGDVTINNAAGASAVNIQDGGNSITVDGAVTTSGTVTEANSGAILTSVQLIDDTVAVLGTDIYTETATKGLTIGAVRRDADTTLVGTTNEIGPLQMDANGRLKVEAFSGEALPVTFTGSTDVATQTTLASLLTSSQLLDDTVATLGTTTYTEAATKGNIIGAVRRDANTSLVDTTNEVAPLQVNSTGELKVAQIQPLPAGTNAIGKLAANSGVDIGDVDITSIAAGDNNIGNVDIVTMPNVVIGSGTVTTVTTVSTVTNQSQEGGVAISLNAGAVDTGTRRVVQANGAGKTILSAGGSASSAGNNTLVAAGTNRLKVKAFSLTTTSTTAMTCIFQSGAGGTELWRVIIQAPSGANAGANLSTSAPDWLFATASATLLNLNLSSANAVHWSVSYYDEA